MVPLTCLAPRRPHEAGPKNAGHIEQRISIYLLMLIESNLDQRGRGWGWRNPDLALKASTRDGRRNVNGL